MKDKLLSGIRGFLSGYYYPIAVGLLALLSHIFALEAAVAPIIVLSCILVLVLLDSAEYILSPLVIFTTLLSRKHTPTVPSYSDYLTRPGVLVLVIIMALGLLAAIVFFFAKGARYRRIKLRGEWTFVSLLIFCAMLFVTAIPTGADMWKNLAFALLQSVALVIPFLLLRFGVSEENKARLADYLSYTALVLSSVIILELLYLYLTGDVLSGGALDKESITLGWGIWNSIGGMLTMTLPLLFLGAVRGKHTAIYLAAATLTYIAAVLTLSRNALVFGTVIFAASLIICALCGEKKKLFRRFLLVLVGIFALIVLIFGSKLAEILSDYINRGFSDNGRFELWQDSLSAFLKNPIFGVGFYGYDGEYYQFAEFMPRLPHNTPLAILGGGGILLSLAYIGYRVGTVIPFVRRPSLEKTLLGISALVLVLGSLLDNFIFNFYPTFMYTAAICIASGYDEG